MPQQGRTARADSKGGRWGKGCQETVLEKWGLISCLLSGYMKWLYMLYVNRMEQWYNMVISYWLVVWNITFFPISWECHHHWRTPSCFRGVAQPPTRSGALRSRFRRGKPTKIIESFSQCLSPGLFHIFSSTVYLQGISQRLEVLFPFKSHFYRIFPWFSQQPPVYCPIAFLVVFPMIFHRFPVIFPRNILHFYGFPMEHTLNGRPASIRRIMGPWDSGRAA